MVKYNNMSQEKTTKEKLLEEFDKTILEPLDKKDWGVCPSQILAIKQFLSQAIDQTREETIRETLKEIRGYIKDNEKIGYENRVLAADEIYAKLSIMYDKSLINK